MSTIIRVKRRLDEEQQVDDKIVLNIKRLKVDNSQEKSKAQEKNTILKFAGTINEETCIEDHLLKLSKTEAENIVGRKNQEGESRLQKRLEENKEKSQKNRFKIINYTRTQSNSENEASNQFTIFDVEKNKHQEATASKQESSSEYVYDIYIADDKNSILPADFIDLNDLSILEYNDYLYSCPRLTNDSDDDEIKNDDDEDSNDENFYGNDYPDESSNEGGDDNESIGEREMRRAMRNFDIENDLSTDDDDDDEYVHSINTQSFHFEDDVDYSDAARYGHAYAKYKKRMLKEMAEDDDDDEDDEEEDDSYSNEYYVDCEPVTKF